MRRAFEKGGARRQGGGRRRENDEEVGAEIIGIEAEANKNDNQNNKSLVSILILLIRKMFFCCCWPIQKCVKVLSCFDTLIVGIFAYKSLDLAFDTINDLHWTTIISTLFFTAFFICQIIGTVFIILAARKNIARYCLPRLVLICGLTVCSLITLIFMITYFAGSSQSVNNFLFKVYEYFFGEQLTDIDKVELKHQLRYYGVAFFLLAATFLMYNVFELWLTCKFKSSLNDFEAVPTEASAPQMSHNPDYGEPPMKVYPNMA